MTEAAPLRPPSGAVEAEAEAGRRPADRTPALIAPATVLVGLVLLFPLVLLFRYSLNRYDRIEFMIDAVTLENYAEFFSDPFYQEVLLKTVEVSLLSTVITLLMSLPVAYYIARAPARWKSALIMLVVFPLFIGNAVRAAGWMAVMGTQGFLNRSLQWLGLTTEPLEILYTQTAVVVGIVAVVLPFMILSIQSVIETVDPAVEEAARNLGATPFQTFRRIVLPLAMPGVIAGTILVFILCMNAYATPVLLGGPRFHMMAPKVYEEITEQANWPFGAALAFVLMIATLALTVLSAWLVQRRYAR